MIAAYLGLALNRGGCLVLDGAIGGHKNKVDSEYKRVSKSRVKWSTFLVFWFLYINSTVVKKEIKSPKCTPQVSAEEAWEPLYT